MPLMTLRKLCQLAGLDYKKFIDDRAAGADFIENNAAGRAVCDSDDCAAAFAYANGREAGLTRAVAGLTAKRLRQAMRDYPDADQLTIVSLENGKVFTHPTASLDLSTGFNSGSYLAHAATHDVRNLRRRVEQAIADEPVVIGADDGDDE